MMIWETTHSQTSSADPSPMKYLHFTVVITPAHPPSFLNLNLTVFFFTRSLSCANNLWQHSPSNSQVVLIVIFPSCLYLRAQ